MKRKLLKEIIDKKGKSLPVTDERMTRFWITLNHGVEFVLNTIDIMQGGELFVPKSPSIKIIDLVKALDKNITILPDCGMGPGMNVTLGLLAMEQLDKPEHLRVWDGGLPLNPNPPWNYSLFFNINGLTNEYDGEAYFLKDGKIDKVPCFEGFEEIKFDF